MNPRAQLLEKVETFQNMLISYSRYETANVDATEFKKLRAELLNDPLIKDRLPRFVRTCREFPQFFGLFQDQSPSYKGRRQFICREFAPLLDFLERTGPPRDGAPVEVPETPLSLDQEAREIIQQSLSQSEEYLTAGQNRQAVQEVLWLLETVSTVFQGIDMGNGATVQGKYFNKIIEDLRKHKHGTTLDQVLEWVTKLHGYLSSPTGGGIRHGRHVKTGVATEPHEARLFCNLVRSYISYLIAEHERLTERRTVLE